jgi:hypothetical protein
MRSTLRLLGILFAAVGCAKSSEPLPTDELAQYQTCAFAEDCVIADNRPHACCEFTTQNPVAINGSQAHEFRAAFDDADCGDLLCAVAAGPDNDPNFIANKYQLSCERERCAIIAVHEHTNDPCNDAMSCPASYDCRPLTISLDQNDRYCWFVANE